MRCGNKWLLTLIVVLAAGGAAEAQLPTFGVGRPPTDAEVAAWNIAIGPDGRELPPGSGTVQQGSTVYAAKCAVCHGKDAESPLPGVPLLVGGFGTLTAINPVKTVGSFYPYATTIWDAIYRAMPLDKPQSLTYDEVYALTAYLLHRNNIIKENEVMDAKSLPKVEMPNRHGFFPENPQYKPGHLQLWFWTEPRLKKRAPAQD
jgi:cytochrome c